MAVYTEACIHSQFSIEFAISKHTVFKPVNWKFWVKVAQNYSYVASTTAVKNAAASQLLTIN